MPRASGVAIGPRPLTGTVRFGNWGLRMASQSFSIIVAVDQNYGIGKNGTLPWRLSGDLKHFKTVTCQTTSVHKKNVVIMGRKTWDSLPLSFRPLPGRVNCVVSHNRQLLLPEGVILAKDFSAALTGLGDKLGEELGEIFVIGGAQLFQEALAHDGCQKMFLTTIMQDFSCDVFFKPDFGRFVKEAESAVLTENGLSYRFVEYSRNS
jgi:dihydrofolate reductase / thymidylate synthase